MSKNISKFLSLVLRHEPQSIGIELDAGGWVSVDDLIVQARRAGVDIDDDALRTVVAESDKKRFTLSADGARIRAAQGHSVAVDLDLVPAVPPEILFHGTAIASLEAILREGLTPQGRQKVHLSADMETAVKVGQRHGKPMVLAVAAGRMQADGLTFWQADNGVWLTDAVPSAYLSH
ncbi:MAG: RNA 2'-phosphotransferase [Shinella sp.]|uniref:RNA 2'-phosphotransferase n=1 Tax=Shinella sp. TaxID=1870904 RepID=UPI0040365DC8